MCKKEKRKVENSQNELLCVPPWRKVMSYAVIKSHINFFIPMISKSFNEEFQKKSH